MKKDRKIVGKITFCTSVITTLLSPIFYFTCSKTNNLRFLVSKDHAPVDENFSYLFRMFALNEVEIEVQVIWSYL